MTYIQQAPRRDLRDFGRKLTAYREAEGMSRIDLADTVDVSQEHIWRLENGFRGCSRDLTIIIGRTLGLNIELINELLSLAGHRPITKRGGSSENRVSRV